MACLQDGLVEHTAKTGLILHRHNPFDEFTFRDFGVAAVERGLYDYRHLVLRVCEP